MIKKIAFDTQPKIRHLASCARRAIKQLFGTDLWTRAEINIPHVRLGSDYGGWVICTAAGLGPDSTVYTVGLGEDASFDLALIERLGCEIFCFDPTPRSVAWVDRQSFPKSLNFYPWGLAGSDGYIQFAAPDFADHASYSAVKSNSRTVGCQVYALSTIMTKLHHSRIDLLKMDIEGSEYDVIKQLQKTGVRPSQMLIEFHHGMYDLDIEETRIALRRLTAMGYKCFSISPSGREYSFILGNLAAVAMRRSNDGS